MIERQIFYQLVFIIAGCSAKQICADELGKLEKVVLFK